LFRQYHFKKIKKTTEDISSFFESNLSSSENKKNSVKDRKELFSDGFVYNLNYGLWQSKLYNQWNREYLTQCFFIGVEGGATSCTVRIKNVYEDLGQYTVSQGVNICSKSHKEVWLIICNTINHLLRKKSLSLTDHNVRFYACFGLAGAASPDARNRFIKYGQENHDFFEKIILETDSHITLTGAYAGKKGAVIIIGTGVVALYRDDKQCIRAGGYGFPHGDEGGWAWFGLKTINYLFRIADGCLPSSPIMDKIFQHYFHKNLSELVQLANGLPRPTVEQYAQIGRYLLSKGDQDQYALQIIKEAACHLNQIYDALEIKCSKEGIKDFPYCLWGGITDYIRLYLKEEFSRKIVKPIAIPVDGALMELQQYLKIPLIDSREKKSFEVDGQMRIILR